MGKRKQQKRIKTDQSTENIKKDPIHILVSTRHNRTFMMTSYDIKTLILFDNPVSEVDEYGNTLVYYSSISIRNM